MVGVKANRGKKNLVMNQNSVHYGRTGLGKPTVINPAAAVYVLEHGIVYMLPISTVLKFTTQHIIYLKSHATLNYVQFGPNGDFTVNVAAHAALGNGSGFDTVFMATHVRAVMLKMTFVTNIVAQF